MGSKKSPIEKEWARLIKDEEKFEIARIRLKPQMLNEKLGKYIPTKLQNGLDKAFNKAFAIIFDKGTQVIGKTYNKGNYEYEYKLKKYALELKENKKNIRKFSKKADGAKGFNAFISGISGIGMGIIGIGIPDIPVFASLVLRSIYEISMSFGFDYEDANEQIFILRLIEVSMKNGIDFADANTELNRLIDKNENISILKDEQINRTSKALGDAMIYMKFIQGIPIVGVLGGSYDFVYMNRISTYAMLKYKRRFLIKKNV